MVLLQRQKSNTSADLSVGYGGDDVAYSIPSSAYQNSGPRHQSLTHTTSTSSLKKSFQQGSNFLGSRPTIKKPSSYYDHDSDCSSSSGSSSSMAEKRDSKRSIVARSSTTSIVQFIIIGALCYFSMKNNQALNAKNTELSTLTSDFEYIQGSLDETTDFLNKAHQDFHKLQTRMLAGQGIVPKAHYAEISPKERADVANGIMEKHDKQSERITQLQKSIQGFHRAELDRRFGPGPYYVEFTLNISGRKAFFTIETAPNDLMPHSVYYFMDMVDRHVWDDTVFVHRWDHVLQAAPISIEGEDRYDEAGGELSFPEFSDEYQHHEFTVGYSGRPGGPEFYINLQDNIEYHGPGKQAHSTVLNDADPCFAKVVIGKDVIQQLKQKSTDAIEAVGVDEEPADLVFTSIERATKIIPSKRTFEAVSREKN